MSSEANGYHCPDSKILQQLTDAAHRMRIASIRATNASKSGHPTSASSCADLVSALFFHVMKYDPKTPRDANSDRFVLSKGHACPILYAAWNEVGLISDKELLSLRKIDSDIEGHPTPRLSFIDVATGSLGQGLSCAAGMAYTGKYFDKASYRVFCMIGDGESAEGSVWEALAFSSHYKLDNLVAIFDVNRLGQSQATQLEHDVQTYKQRLAAFGWEVIVIDGHDMDAICKAFHTAKTIKSKPTAIVAKTFKGRDFPNIENLDGFHGKPLLDKSDVVIKHLQDKIKGAKTGPCPLKALPAGNDAPVLTHGYNTKISLSTPPAYKLGDQVATRAAYGTALVKLGENSDRVVALDGDVKNSTMADKFAKKFPERFVECYIAEQNLVGVAVGCATRDRTVPFCSTFATFFTRANDQLRMAAVSMSNINCVGSHVGVHIGEDGPSQMGLEDIAMFRTLPNSTVFYPSDAVSAERAVELAARTKGICFIRTGRNPTAVLYKNDEKFVVGECKIVRESGKDKVCIVSSGITLYEAIAAADNLKADGIECCIIDLFTVKPMDSKTIIEHAKRCGNKIVTVEDHYIQGGIGEAVSSALQHTGIRIKSLAVTALPRSGPPAELLEMFGISASHIEKAVKSMV